MAENRKRNQIQFLGAGADPATFETSKLLYPGALGGIYTDANGGEWRLVQGDSTMTTAPFPGCTLWWSNRANYLVTTATTNRGQIAGVLPCFAKDGVTRVPSKSTAGTYFFIQRGGLAKIKFVDAPTSNPTAAGLFVIPSATAGKADCLAAGSAPTYPPIGRSAGTYDAANTECVVEIDIPDATD